MFTKQLASGEKMYKEIIIKDINEMKRFAYDLSKTVFPGYVLCL